MGFTLTATIIAVFAPVGFMPGIIGQFFKAFALAACISVFFSLVVARLLTPMMAAYLLKNPARPHADPCHARAWALWTPAHRLVRVCDVSHLDRRSRGACLSG